MTTTKQDTTAGPHMYVAENEAYQFELTEDQQKAVNISVDIADHITPQSIGFAQSVMCTTRLDADVLALVAIHAQIASRAYAEHELSAVLRELAPEIAGAISEAGTDVGAGIVQGLQSLKLRMRNFHRAAASTTRAT